MRRNGRHRPRRLRPTAEGGRLTRRRARVVRFLAGAAAAVAALVVALAAGAYWAIAVSAAWSAFALVTLALVWLRIGGMDAEATRRHAQEEDFSRVTADAIVLAASVVSLIAVGFVLIHAGNRDGWTKVGLIALAASTVALSWLVVHTRYALRYGDLYYRHGVGGIGFAGDLPPDYRDFAYLALTVGMTFQVSDTTLESREIRRAATGHALLSYLFGAVIVAVAINAVASLLQ